VEAPYTQKEEKGKYILNIKDLEKYIKVKNVEKILHELV
jgi:hypothetical protein